MKVGEKSKEYKNIRVSDSSFEEDINELNNILENKSNQNLDFKFEKEKNFIEKDNSQNIFFNKHLEEADLNEIYDVLNEIDKAITIDINSINKEEYPLKKRDSYSPQNTKTIKNEHFNECQEILSILKKPLSNKNIRNINVYDTPFKPLLKPKKISMVGKILFDSQNENSNTECDSKSNDCDKNYNILEYNKI